MSTLTTASIPEVIKTYYERMLLDRLVALYPHCMFAQQGKVQEIPGGSGKTIEWRRHGNLPAATTPLTEGVPPSEGTAAVTQIAATPQQFGYYIKHSDVLTLTSIDDLIAQWMVAFGDQAGNTLDQLCRDVLAAGTNVQYADGVADRASVAIGNKISSLELLKCVRTLEGGNVPRIADAFGGSYVSFVSEGTAFDLRLDPGWNEVNKYNNGGAAIYSGELGRMYGIRFVQTTNAKIFEDAGASSIDVHATVVLGANAYGMAAFKGQGAPTMYVTQPGESGISDPLHQIGTIGWKLSHKSKILEEARIVRIEHAVTAAS